MNIKMKNNKTNKISKKNRIAIVDVDKCRPDKCSLQCKKSCPVEAQGIECITIMTDIEDVSSINKSKKNKKKIC